MTVTQHLLPCTPVATYAKQGPVPIQASQDLARRLRAAKELAGITSTAKLAAKINEKGLGTKTLRAIEQGRRGVEDSELYAISKATGLDPSFFTQDYSLSPGTREVLAIVRENRTQITRIEEALAQSQLALEAMRLLQTAALGGHGAGGHTTSPSEAPDRTPEDHREGNAR